MSGGLFLTVKDLQLLLGETTYKAAHRIHLSIRDAMGKRSKLITIKEYCEYEQLDLNYIWLMLRGEPYPEYGLYALQRKRREKLS